MVKEIRLLTIMGFREASETWSSFDAVISIEDVERGSKLRLPEGSEDTDHLVLQFHDLDYDDGRTVVCTREHVQQALDFARKHEGGRLLLHCQAGKCRSPGIGLAIIADKLGQGREVEAVETLMHIREVAAVNLVVLQVADDVLGRGGRLVEAWMAREDGDERIARLRRIKQESWERFWAKGGQ